MRGRCLDLSQRIPAAFVHRRPSRENDLLQQRHRLLDRQPISVSNSRILYLARILARAETLATDVLDAVDG